MTNFRHNRPPSTLPTGSVFFVTIKSKAIYTHTYISVYLKSKASAECKRLITKQLGDTTGVCEVCRSVCQPPLRTVRYKEIHIMASLTLATFPALLFLAILLDKCSSWFSRPDIRQQAISSPFRSFASSVDLRTWIHQYYQ